MVESGEDDRSAAITDVTTTGNYANDDAALETAINSIILALEKAGIVIPN